MTPNDDLLVERARQRGGALGAIRAAAECVFSDVTSLDASCRMMKGERIDQIGFRESTSLYVADLVRGVARLEELLREHAELWARLRLANPYPATLGDEYADCYAGLALEMGNSRISYLRLIIGGRRRFSIGPITDDDLWSNHEEIITCFAEHIPFACRLAVLHLAKECQRVTGKVTRPVRRRGGRKQVPAVAKRRQEIVRRSDLGEKPGTIAEALDVSVEIVYADLARARSKSDATALSNSVSDKKIR